MAAIQRSFDHGSARRFRFRFAAGDRGFFSGALLSPNFSDLEARPDTENWRLRPELGPQSDYFVNHALPAFRGVFIDDVVSLRVCSDRYSRQGAMTNSFATTHLWSVSFSLDLEFKIQAGWMRQWRENMINGRLSVSARLFHKRSSSAFKDIQPWKPFSSQALCRLPIGF
jgi:hypothetical protein